MDKTVKEYLTKHKAKMEAALKRLRRKVESLEKRLKAKKPK